MRKLLVAAFFLFGLVAVAAGPKVDNPILQNAIDTSVRIATDKTGGSGVVFNNGDTSFVWTCAHVVANRQKVELVFDQNTGMPRVNVQYADVWIVQEEVNDGRKTSEHWELAEIVRFSDPMRGEDLALLRVIKKKAYSKSVKFSGNDAPNIGAEIWHIGSMMTAPGHNSVSPGVIAAIGRLRKGGMPNEIMKPTVADQITAPLLPGSSGGGVFLKKTGECLGLVMERLVVRENVHPEAINCMIPTRRIREYAKRAECLWAIDNSVNVPEDVYKNMTDCPLPLPKDLIKPVEMNNATP